MKLSEIIAELEKLAPPGLQEDYDNSGLIVGKPTAEVTKALLCIDSTEEVIREAVDLGCDLVIAHHPIVFRGMKRFNSSNYVQRAVEFAIKNDVAIYACHTNLDNVPDGVNGKIADKLGLINRKVLRPLKGHLKKLVVFTPQSHAEAVLNAMLSAGAGHIGNYDECSFSLEGSGTFRAGDGSSPFIGEKGIRHTEQEYRQEVILPIHALPAVKSALRAVHPYEEIAWDLYNLENSWTQAGSGLIADLPNALSPSDFLRYLKDRMELPFIRYSKGQSEKVHRIAICGGAGSFLITDALRTGAQAFITGDVKYHEFFDAENSMMICDIGHYESEKYTIEIFARILSLKFPNFATIFAKTPTNPVNYY